MAAMTDYLENKLIDQIFRAQAFVFPATFYIGLLTAAPTDATAGTEVTGGAYARSAVTNGLTAWAGTQAAASVVASTGATGTTSNNAAVAFAAPTVAWGVVTHIAIWDALTVGNMLFYSALAVPKTINAGDAAPAFAIGALTIQIDN